MATDHSILYEAEQRTVLATQASQARATLDDGFLDDIWPDILARVGLDLAFDVALERGAGMRHQTSRCPGHNGLPAAIVGARKQEAGPGGEY